MKVSWPPSPKGGVGVCVPYPPNGQDGHSLFTQAPEVWRPKVLQFLLTNGYPALKPPDQER